MMNSLKSVLSDTNPLRLWYHRIKGRAAAKAFGYPAKQLRVIGVTGTDGKTTTVSMIAHILHAAGKKVGASTSASFFINGARESNPTQKTTLPAHDMQKFLRRVVDEGCEYAIIEVSSHGLLQGRLFGLFPHVAAITNISPEHLDYHKTMEHYMDTKKMLFTMLNGHGTKILNGNDQTYQRYKDVLSDRTIVYNKNTDSDSLWMDQLQVEPSMSHAVLHAGSSTYDLQLTIPGVFNLENALCAIACAKAVGISIQQSIDALKAFTGASGRMEKIDEGQPFSVFIDFTVTPNAYEKTLSSLKAMLKNDGRLLVLTGSCGDRMKEKRPLVGKLCATYADVVVVTNEDPYTEDPQTIIDEVYAGAQSAMHKGSVTKILDRLEAIRFLIKQAKPNDIILFAGKGGDVTMWTAKGQIPWDEDAIVRNELRQLRI